MVVEDKYLAHHGVVGQRKGRRRYQNYDGTHTPLGRARDRSRKSNRFRAAAKAKNSEVYNKDFQKDLQEKQEQNYLKSYNKFYGGEETVSPEDRMASNHVDELNRLLAELDSDFYKDDAMDVASDYINRHMPKSQKDAARAFVWDYLEKK